MLTRSRLSVAAPLTIVACALCLLSCAISDDLSGSLSGTVRSADTSAPLPGAVVQCQSMTSVADATGGYYIDSLSPGDAIVSCEVGGYKDYDEVVDIQGATAHNISMEVYHPPARLFGYVTHSVFGALEGAEVQLGDLETTTDEEGFYEFDGLEQSVTYHMTISLDGYRQFSTSTLTPTSSDYQYDVSLKKLASAILYSIADADLDEDLPDANYGGSDQLRLDHDMIFHYTFVMKFDLSSLEETAEPVSATLWLYYTGDDTQPVAREILVGRASRAWDEMIVSWSDNVGSLGASVVSSSFEMPWYQMDVENPFRDWLLTGHNNNGILVDSQQNTAASRFYFASREYFEEDRRPYVVLEYAW